MQLLFNKLIPGSAGSSKAQLTFIGNLEKKKKPNEDILPQVAFESVAADPAGTIQVFGNLPDLSARAARLLYRVNKEATVTLSLSWLYWGLPCRAREAQNSFLSSGIALNQPWCARPY